jgi:hypothetical protein
VYFILIRTFLVTRVLQSDVQYLGLIQQLMMEAEYLLILAEARSWSHYEGLEVSAACRYHVETRKRELIDYDRIWRWAENVVS